MQTIKEAIADGLTFTDWFKQSGHPIERKNKLQLIWEHEFAMLQTSLLQKDSTREFLIVVDSNGFPPGGHRAAYITLQTSRTEAAKFGLEHFGKFNFQIIKWTWFKKSQIGKYIFRRQRIMARRKQFKSA